MDNQNYISKITIIYKERISKIVKPLLLLTFFITLAVISTYPAFIEHYFKMTMDGQIHFARFESVIQALKNGKLPPNINFIGYGNVGEAFSSTYPWLTALIFIVPRIIINNPFHAMFAGFFVLNFITIISSYLLVRCLTNKPQLRLLGVVIYQMNSYHFIDLYARNAMGESLAYAFIPLVFMGCHQIWNDNRHGIFSLALGMGLIFNSHMITSFFAVIILFLLEAYRLISKKTSFKEFFSFIFSICLFIPTILFSAINIFKIIANNNIATTWRGLNTINPWHSFQLMISNVITDNSETYNIGIVCLIMLFIMLFLSFKNNVSEHAHYIWFSIIIYILTLNWYNPPQVLKESILGSLQFTGRLLTFTIILMTIGSILILDTMSKKINITALMLLFTMLVSFTAFNSVMNYHDTKNDDPIRLYINKNNFSSILEPSFGSTDYAIIDKKKQPVFETTLKADKKFNIKSINYNKIVITTSKNSKKITVPFMLYKSVPYSVSLNGKHITNVRKGSTLKLKLNNRKNTIVIKSDAPKINYLTFAVSIISIILLTIAMLFYNREIQQC